MQSAVLLSAWIQKPTALPFGRLAQRGGASTGKSQQRFIRVSPKGMGKESLLQAMDNGYACSPKCRTRKPSAGNR
jgi:hypothetical protein